MPKGDKYIELKYYLKNSNEPMVKLTFKDIEEIISGKLPPSAYKHSSVWWSNNRDHSQAIAWMDAGYETDFVADTCKDEVIVFIKGK